jgi:hypothetical protein
MILNCIYAGNVQNRHIVQVTSKSVKWRKLNCALKYTSTWKELHLMTYVSSCVTDTPRAEKLILLTIIAMKTKLALPDKRCPAF